MHQLRRRARRNLVILGVRGREKHTSSHSGWPGKPSAGEILIKDQDLAKTFRGGDGRNTKENRHVFPRAEPCLAR